jgi:dipeptidase
MSKKKIISLLAVSLMIVISFGFSVYAQCTSITVGKEASVDGSVITHHNCDGWYDASLIVIPAEDHAPGTMAPIWFNKLHQDQKEPKIIGEIPQVPHTYKYFWVGYPCANEHQIMIGENTIGGDPTLRMGPEAIMWIEQLEIFALQRAKTAREAIQIMGELAEKYGYPDRGENLSVTDPNEAWSFEILGVGPLWDPESGEPGAVWAAQRVPDDHIYVSANFSRIDKIDPNDTENFIVCENYIDTAVEMDLYDPTSDKPFSWREAYGDIYGRNNTRTLCWGRLWSALNYLAPSAAPLLGAEQRWSLDQAPYYPFSVKPDKKLSVQDVYATINNTNVGTEYDNTEDPAWYVKNGGECVKSPLATPHPTGELVKLLSLDWLMPIPMHLNSYHFISQARSWLPNEIGGIFWFGLDNPHNSIIVPVYVGVNDVAPSWKLADRTKINRDCAWWAFGLVDDQVNRLYGQFKPMLDEVRIPLQNELFDKQEETEQEALDIYETDPESVKDFLTDYTINAMERAEKTYWDILDVLMYNAHNNNQSLYFRHR